MTGGCRHRSAIRDSSGWPTASPAVYAATSAPASVRVMLSRANRSRASGTAPSGSRPTRLADSTRTTCGARSTATAPAGLLSAPPGLASAPCYRRLPHPPSPYNGRSRRTHRAGWASGGSARRAYLRGRGLAGRAAQVRDGLPGGYRRCVDPVVLVLLVLVVAGALWWWRNESTRRQERELADAEAEARRWYERLGGQVLNLSGDDPAVRQALADAGERYNAAGSQLGQARSVRQFRLAQETALEGLMYARAARLALGMDPGPPLPPLAAARGAGELRDTREVEVEGQSFKAGPDPGADTPYYYPGGRLQGRPVPAGWYSQPIWKPALAGAAGALSAMMIVNMMFPPVYGGFGDGSEGGGDPGGDVGNGDAGGDLGGDFGGFDFGGGDFGV